MRNVTSVGNMCAEYNNAINFSSIDHTNTKEFLSIRKVKKEVDLASVHQFGQNTYNACLIIFKKLRQALDF